MFLILNPWQIFLTSSRLAGENVALIIFFLFIVLICEVSEVQYDSPYTVVPSVAVAGHVESQQKVILPSRFRPPCEVQLNILTPFHLLAPSRQPLTSSRPLRSESLRTSPPSGSQKQPSSPSTCCRPPGCHLHPLD